MRGCDALQVIIGLHTRMQAKAGELVVQVGGGRGGWLFGVNIDDVRVGDESDGASQGRRVQRLRQVCCTSPT